MREKHLKENLADMAYKAESDHEVQMARGDLYKIAKYAIKLHEMLKGVEEREGLDGWVAAKITKAADYIGSVYHHLDYELKFDEVVESKKMPMGAGPDGKKGTDDDKPAFLNQTTDSKKSKGGSKPKKGEVPPQFKKKTESYKLSLADSLAETLKAKLSEKRDTHCSDECCGADTKAEDCTCPPTCKHCNCNASKEAVKESTQMCNECGKTMLTASEKKELAELEEGKRHGNSKIYKKCWKGCRKVAGKKRGEPGSCKCD